MGTVRLRQVFEQLDAALEPEDLADVAFLIEPFRLTEGDLTEAFERLPARFKADPVVQDNLRYVTEDCNHRSELFSAREAEHDQRSLDTRASKTQPACGRQMVAWGRRPQVGRPARFKSAAGDVR